MKKLINLNNVKIIDLSHTLTPKIPQWHLGCGFQTHITCDYEDCKDEAKFQVQKLEMSAGIGTHIDAPLHCFQDGKSVADIALEDLIAHCFVIDVSKKAHENYLISADDVTEFENIHGKITKNSIVIFNTGWWTHWSQPEKYRNNLIFPTISKETASMLLNREILGVGIDTLSPDGATSGFPVHQLILGAGKFIIENVANTNLLPPTGSVVIVMPIKIEGGTESPIRLIGITNK